MSGQREGRLNKIIMKVVTGTDVVGRVLFHHLLIGIKAKTSA